MKAQAHRRRQHRTFKGKFPTVEEMKEMKIDELKLHLNKFPGTKKSFTDKDELIQRLSDLYHRKEVLDDLGHGR